MKIVHLIGHLELGGAEVLISNLIKYQISKDLEIELWCLERSKNQKFENEVIEKLRKYGIDVKILTESKNRLKRIIELLLNIRKYKPDIINSHLTYVTGYAILGKILSLKSGVKIVETIHNTKLSQIFITRIISNYFTEKTIAITPKIKEILLNTANVNENKVVVIENGVEIFSNNFVIRKNVKRIISVGRLTEQKNHIFLLKAYFLLKKELENLPVLEIYGEGELKENLQNYINKNNLQENVKLRGTSLNILEELEKSDIYAMVSKYEGLSISLLEALGVGIPIVATAVPGIKDVLVNKEAEMIELDNVQDLKRGLKELILNIEKRKNYSIQGIETSKLYSLSEKALIYNKLYYKILEK